MDMLDMLDGKKLYVTMPDRSVWAVDVQHIIANRAADYHKHHPDEFPTLELAIAETVGFFSASHYEIMDWAANEMDWSDVSKYAELYEAPPEVVNYYEGWVNGESWVQ